MSFLIRIAIPPTPLSGYYRSTSTLPYYRVYNIHNWRWSETTRNYVGPPEHSYPVVLWTTKISSPKPNRNMPQRYKQLSPLETLYPLSPFLGNKTRVRNHEGHELLTLRSIIILEPSPVDMPFVVLQNYWCGNTWKAWKNFVQHLQVL